MHRLAVVASHPIQYQAPWFRALASVTDLEVFFCHQQDASGQSAAGFDVRFEWDVPLLEGYSHRWLRNRSRHPDVARFSGCDTPGIDDEIAGGRFDACIVTGWYLRSYLQAIRASRRARVPVLARGDSQLATPRSSVRRAAKYLPYRWFLGAIDAHLYVGQANREYLAHYGVSAAQMFFTPHFIDNAFFRTGAEEARQRGDTAAIRSALGIPSDATLFAFAGKLIDKKRPGDLIRALAAARASGGRGWVMFVGSGPLQGDLERLVAESAAPVRFAGFRNQTEMPRYLAAADALVLPSDGGETWGLVVNEAMACGLPAIVSDAAGCARDLIEDGQTGYRFPMGDVTALADALVRFERAGPRERSAFGAAVAAKVARYTCGSAVDGTLEALEAVTAKRSQRAPRLGRPARRAS